MNREFPRYPEGLGKPRDWKVLNLGDRYARFDQLILDAEKAALFDTLPAGRKDTLTGAFVKRGETMAERLWLLGYIEAPDKHLARDLFQKDRRGFAAAVARFQADAGLKVDAWTGVKTWGALERLVSFESDLLLPAWKASPENYPAVQRAAQCRLHVLGLAPGPPKGDFTKIPSAGLKKFRLMLMALGIIHREQLDPGTYLRAKTIDRETLTLLMDQDSLVAMAAKSVTHGQDGSEFFFVKEAKTLRPHGHEVRKFLTRLVQVEFWLLGYDIPITKALTCPVRGIDPINKVACAPELGQCLKDVEGLAGSPRDGWAEEITPALFAALVAADEQEDEKAVHDGIEERLKTQRAVEKALEKGRNFHLRLWDGMKRVMRWIGRLFKRAGKTILDTGRAVARYFYQSAYQVFDRVKTALRITADALSALGGTGEVSTDVLISVSFDGDILVGVSPKSHAGSQTAVKKLKLNAERFCLAARICAMVMAALLDSALARWAALAKALYGQLKECVHLFGEILSLEAELAALESTPAG